MNPLNQFPHVRRIAYYVAFGIGLVLGAVQVGYGAAEVGQPTWLTVTLAVYAFAASYLGLTAARNTPRAGAIGTPGPRRGSTAPQGSAVDA